MAPLPRGFRPRASAGVSFLKLCSDCTVKPDYVRGGACPAIALMKEAGIRPFRKEDHPSEPQNATGWAESFFAAMRERAQRIGCKKQRLFTTAEKEFDAMLDQERKRGH